MKILSLNNGHIKKDTESLGYGCVCPYCDTVFIFDSKDISRPRTPFPDPKIVRLHVLIQAVAGYYQWIIHAFILLKAVMKNMNLNTGMTSRRITKWQKNFQ